MSKNVNTDEAAAMGAVYQAASLSKQFKVKKFIVKDTTVYPIQVGTVLLWLLRIVPHNIVWSWSYFVEPPLHCYNNICDGSIHRAIYIEIYNFLTFIL